MVDIKITIEEEDTKDGNVACSVKIDNKNPTKSETGIAVLLNDYIKFFFSNHLKMAELVNSKLTETKETKETKGTK